MNLKTHCILYVEDDENDVLVLRHVFQKAGLAGQLQVVRDGQMAIDYLSGAGAYADREKYPLPYLVLLDLGLPERGGLEVLQWIRQHPSLKKLVVLVLTSSPFAEDVDRACELGANSYLTKPSGLPKNLEMAQLLKSWWLDYNHFAPIEESENGFSPIS
jgi:CheY-like chemotaxis protein